MSEQQPIEGHTYYDQGGGLRHGESMASYLARGPICLTHGGTTCAEEELAKITEQVQKSKIVVPEGMLKAAIESLKCSPVPMVEHVCRGALEVALLWQRENAPVPSESQIREAIEAHRCDVNLWNRFGSSDSHAYHCWAWIRRMYDAPEPEFEQKEVFFNKPGDYYVHVPASGAAPEVGPIESFVRGRASTK